MVATSGAQLLPADAVKVLIEHLLPLTTILTPNLPEAKLLLQTAGQVCEGPKTVDDIVAMAKSLRNLGPKYVLLKGGHIPLNKDRVVPSDEAERHTVLNVLAGEAETVVIENSYLRSKNTHGTGCSLACKLINILPPSC
jgi:hydroxymethylpyrimidine kinase/phosphomethylpyrimidine kinase